MLLEKARSGRVPLKDGGKKLEERLAGRRAELADQANAVHGKVLSFSSADGVRHGPFTPRQLQALAREGLCPESATIEHAAGRQLALEEATAMPEPLTAMLLKELHEQHTAAKTATGAGEGTALAAAGAFPPGPSRKDAPSPSKRRRERRVQQQWERPRPAPTAWQIASATHAELDAQEVSIAPTIITHLHLQLLYIN